MSLPEDILICSNVGVATGQGHLFFIGVPGDGLGGLSEAQHGSDGKHNPGTFPGTGELKDPPQFISCSQIKSTPPYFPTTHKCTQFTSHLCFRTKISFLPWKPRNTSTQVAGLLSPSHGWVLGIGNPEHS
jgi:hypothetical protein